jgi:sterol 3beta-glucosyltransferase
MPWVSAIAEKTGKRWALVQLSFPMTPTHEFPFAGLDFLSFPAYNHLSYQLVRSSFWRQIKPAVNDFRRSLGLPAAKRSIFDKADADGVLTAYAISPALLSRPADWRSNIQVTGFLTMPTQPVHPKQSDEAPISTNRPDFLRSLQQTAQSAHPTQPDETPVSENKFNVAGGRPQPAVQSENNPEALSQWLQAGEKPIYIGFGSMPILGPALFRQLLIDLLAFTPYRYLFCTGWSAAFDLPSHPRLFITPSTGHDWLFPECQAAIIHGGIGTLAATLRAAVPPIIVSIFGDQHWWGKLIQNRHLGRHIPFKQLSSAKLISAIQSVLSPATPQTSLSPSIAQNLRALASQLNRENGLQDLLTRLDEYFSFPKLE